MRNRFFSHFLLAHAEAYFRDLDRLAAAAQMADVCPLGPGVGGCAFPLDREALARELDFSRVSANSLDAVGDRDFALDYLYALATFATLCASGRGFRIVCLAGVSVYRAFRRVLDRQQHHAAKENSDVWELLRGKTGRITAALISLLITLKGLPSSYQRDLQKTRSPSSPHMIRR